jgi:hypothetical protein
VDQVIQMVGALLILAAFIGAQTGRFDPHNRVYLWLNLFGAAILAVVAFLTENWGFTLLEAVWTVVSAASLWKVYGSRRRAEIID